MLGPLEDSQVTRRRLADRAALDVNEGNQCTPSLSLLPFPFGPLGTTHFHFPLFFGSISSQDSFLLAWLLLLCLCYLQVAARVCMDFLSLILLSYILSPFYDNYLFFSTKKACYRIQLLYLGNFPLFSSKEHELYKFLIKNGILRGVWHSTLNKSIPWIISSLVLFVDIQVIFYITLKVHGNSKLIFVKDYS